MKSRFLLYGGIKQLQLSIWDLLNQFVYFTFLAVWNTGGSMCGIGISYLGFFPVLNALCSGNIGSICSISLFCFSVYCVLSGCSICNIGGLGSICSSILVVFEVFALFV